MTRKNRCPARPDRGHAWGPQSFDGYAYCDRDGCTARIRCRFDLPPIDVAAAHVIADIRGTGLRSNR